MTKKTEDEQRLENIAQNLLAMPHKPRDESKIGKPTAKAKKSHPTKKKPNR